MIEAILRRLGRHASVETAHLLAALLRYRRIKSWRELLESRTSADDADTRAAVIEIIEEIEHESGDSLSSLEDERANSLLEQLNAAVLQRQAEELPVEPGRGDELLELLRSRPTRDDPISEEVSPTAREALLSKPGGSEPKFAWGKGKDEELAKLIQSVCPALFRARGVPQADIADLVSDVYLSVRRYLEQDAGEIRSFRSFLKWRALGVLKVYVRQLSRFTTVDVPLDPVDETRRPWDQAQLMDLERALQECRDRLKPIHARAWQMRHDEGLGTVRIADELGIPKGTLYVALYRASTEIWKCLKRKGVLG